MQIDYKEFLIDSLHMVKVLLLVEPCLQVKVHSHRAKARAKISFEVCHLFFDIFRSFFELLRFHFRFLWVLVGLTT